MMILPNHNVWTPMCLYSEPLQDDGGLQQAVSEDRPATRLLP